MYDKHPGERTAGVGDPRCRWDSPEPMRPYAHSLELLRAAGHDRLRFVSHAPMSTTNNMSEFGGPRAGALAHKYQDRTW